MKQNLVQLMEAELEKAETALAVKDLGDKVQDMMEDVAKLRVDSLMAIAETVKEQFGVEEGDRLFDTLDNLLGSLQDDMKTAKAEIDNQVAYLNGESPQMGTDMDMPDMGVSDMEPSMDEPPMDDMFGADDVNAGGDAPLGRMKRESLEDIKRQMAILEAKMKRAKQKK